LRTTTNTIYNFKTTTTEPPDSRKPTPPKPGQIPLLQRVNTYLRRWAGKKYRRLRTFKRFKRWWTRVLEREPGLFAHWRWVHAY
jgi:hypothetical protein